MSVVLFICKALAYFLTHSLAILTDALESIVNVVAGFIGVYSLHIAAKPKDIEHPYGHGKAEFLSAAAEGIMIVGAGALIFYEAIKNFIGNNPIQKLDSGLFLVAATAIVNYFAGTFCLKKGRQNNSLALQASGKHLQTDTYSTLAIIAGLILMLATGLYWLDKAIALVMGLFIIYNGYTIVRSSVAGIMDEADMKLLKRMVDLLNTHRRVNWIDLHNLRVIKYGTRLHVDCHLTVPWYHNIHEAHREVDQLSSVIQEEFGDVIELFVHTDGCLPISCPICVKEECPVRQQIFKERIPFTLKNLVSNEKHTVVHPISAGN